MPKKVCQIKNVSVHDMIGTPEIIGMTEWNRFTLFSYTNRRRIHKTLGPMPKHIAMVNRRKVWNKYHIIKWLEGNYNDGNTTRNTR